MNLKRLFAAIIMLVSVQAMAQTKLIEKVTAEEGKLVIPYEKYLLPNGLTLIVHEDHSDPIVHVDVTYHVGSAREEIGKSGFAHFFEHMMFQGSEHVADEQHFGIISAAGGTLNGTTNRDRTNYFETLPSNQLEVALWLESDRMGFLLDSVTQKKFEVQRATVKNERGQRYDNRPYGLVNENISKVLYPYGHPYSWMTIGYVEDLNRVDVNDLKNFFLRWYGPNNAVLTVGGDVDPKEVVKLVEKYFGSIPRGPEVDKMHLDEPVLEKDRYITMEDNIMFPLLELTYPTVPSGHADEPALDVLADILGGGNNSIFYKNFVKNQLALQAAAYHPTSELAGEFTMAIYAAPGTNLSTMDSLVRASIAEFETRGVTDDDLTRAKAGIVSGMINGLESVRGKVSQLASYYTFFGDANRIQKNIDAYQNVTKEDVLRAYNKYIKGKHSVVLSAVPKGKTDMAAREQNFTAPTSGVNNFPQVDYTGLKYVKAVDNFDRNIQPKPGPAPKIKVPEFYTGALTNGIPYIGTENREIPTVTVQITIKGGHLLETAENAGIADIVASLMNESTENYTAEAIQNELDKLGSRISFSAGEESTFIYVNTLKENFSKTMALLEEKLLHPLLSEEDFNRIKNLQIRAIANRSTQATSIASLVFDKLIFGENNIKSIPASGTVASLSSITHADVVNFYKNYYSPKVTSVVVVGDLNEAEALKRLDFLNSWTGKDVVIPTSLPHPNIEETTIYLVNKPGAAQSEIRIGYVAIPFDATGEYFKLNMVNFPLGGSFNSRINQNLREDKGWTYGARSGFSGTKYAGPYTAYAGVKVDATDSSIMEFLIEMEKYAADGITEEELAFTKNSLTQSEALDYETSRQKAAFLRQILAYGLDADFTKDQYKIIQKMKAKEINALASKYLTRPMVIVVVGDKAKIEAGLKALGLNIVELDTNGDPIKE